MTAPGYGRLQSREAFSPVADPDLVFDNALSAELFGRLRAFATGGPRLAVLTGEPGTGKTTLLRRLMGVMERAGSRTMIEALPLGLDELRGRLPAPEPGRGVVAGLDEAQALPRELLASLDALLTARPDVRLVLAGQLSLDDRLAALGDGGVPLPAMVRCRLAPLAPGEVGPYIDRRWRKVNAGRNPFTSAATERIAAASEGIPRMINLLCSRLVRLAEVSGRDQISAEMIDEVTRDLPRPAPARRQGRAAPPGAARGWRPARAAVAGAVIVPLVVLGAGIVIGPAMRRAEPPERQASTAWLGRGDRAELPRIASLSPESRPAGPASDADAAPALPPLAAAPRPEQAAPPLPVANRRMAPAPPSPARPAPVTRREPARDDALLRRSEDGDVQGIRALLAAGASPEAQDAAGFTPLMLAVIHGHAAALDVLIQGGAAVNARNRAGLTPLMLAAINSRAAELAALIDRGADPNQVTRAGWTALTYAAWRGHADVVRLLLARGADPNVRDREGWTALHYATWRAAEPIPDAELPTDASTSEVSRVSGAGPAHREVIALLRQAGARR